MNIIIPINSSNFNILLLNKNLEIYKREGVHVYLSVMGAGINHVKDNLKSIIYDTKSVSITYDENSFNYSYAVNRVLRVLNGDEIVIIGDFWTPVSLWQIEKDLKNIDLEKDFLIVNAYKDNKNFGQPINLRSQKFMASLVTRLSRMSNPSSDIPIVVSTVFNISSYINGLEESIPTSVARYLLKYKLEEFGFNKVVSAKDSLTIQPINHNKNIINEFISNDFIFMRSNVKNDKWGIDLPTSTPLNSHTSQYNGIRTIQSSSKPITKKISSVSQIKSEPSKSKVLLLVNSDIKSIIQSSTIMKYLGNEGYLIDVLTNDKENDVARLFPSRLFSYMNGKRELSNNNIRFDQYNKILNFNSSIKLPKSIVAEVIDFKNNYTPECEYKYPNVDIPPGTLFIANSQFNNTSYTWDKYEELIFDLFQKIPNIIMYNYSGETELYNRNIFNSQNNFIKPQINNLQEVVGIMKQCSAILTNQNTNTFWLAYGSNTPTIVYEGPPSNIPNSKNVTIAHKRECKKCHIDRCIDFECLKNLDSDIISSIIYENM